MATTRLAIASTLWCTKACWVVSAFCENFTSWTGADTCMKDSASVASYNQLGDETWLYIEGRSISPDSFAGIAVGSSCNRYNRSPLTCVQGNRKTPVLLWYRQISQ